jgi:ketosteroid isomerase-like protein
MVWPTVRTTASVFGLKEVMTRARTGTYLFARIERTRYDAQGRRDTSEGSAEFLTILEKQIDGSWKIAIDCFSFSAPLGRIGWGGAQTV